MIIRKKPTPSPCCSHGAAPSSPKSCPPCCCCRACRSCWAAPSKPTLAVQRLKRQATCIFRCAGCFSITQKQPALFTETPSCAYGIKPLFPNSQRAQLLGQHRECAALRGNGWGRPHATVNYVFTHSPYLLYAYHVLIMDEMQRRGYRPDPAWHDKNHRGNTCPPYADLAEEPIGSPIYVEHDDDYLAECLANLRSKGIEVQG